uniref:C-type lectin domain-containing protein n=2 Tax=Strongyloides stercoralis TaxID=6248 RepID=A0A0K0E4G1_STRER
MLSLLKILSFIFLFNAYNVYGLDKHNTNYLFSTPSPTNCTLSSLDIVFVVDESGSIGQTNYFQAMHSLSVMVNDSLKIGQSVSDSHVGMVLFNSEPYLYFNLSRYSNNEGVAEAIYNAPYNGGGTNIYLALKYGIENIFGGSGDRVSDPNVILLITDGQDSNADKLKQLNIEATNKNITIFAIGVGGDVDYAELLAAAGNTSRVFTGKSYSDLEEILGIFCKSAEDNLPKPDIGTTDSSCSTNIENLWIDMVFVVDGSKGVNKLGLLGIEGAIAGFVSTNFTIGRNNGRYSRAGIVKMGTSATIIADLNKYYSTSQFMNEIFNIPYEDDEEPNIYDGLKKADAVLSRATGNPNRRQIVYLFSSKTNIDCESKTRSFTDQDPCRLAASMKEKGITIVTFALRYDGSKNVQLMTDIGSECFNFYNDVTIIEDMITSALYVNCFCPQPLIQFKNDSSCLKTAECIYVHETPSTWSTAEIICPLDGANATLVNDFSIEKNKFLVEQLNTYNSYPYHIGLHLQSGNFMWDSNSYLGDYINWDVNEPNRSKGNCVQINSGGKWQMVNCDDFEQASNYICEEPACDADNYCP